MFKTFIYRLLFKLPLHVFRRLRLRGKQRNEEADASPGQAGEEEDEDEEEEKQNIAEEEKDDGQGEADDCEVCPGTEAQIFSVYALVSGSLRFPACLRGANKYFSSFQTVKQWRVLYFFYRRFTSTVRQKEKEFQKNHIYFEIMNLKINIP